MLKNVRFGKWDLGKDSFLSNPTVTILSTTLAEIIPDMEGNMVKKTTERKKYFWVVNILKESMGATTITKHILDFGINLVFGELLASAPAVEK